MAIKKLLRKDLKEGQLYYSRRKYYKNDYLIIWEVGPNYNNHNKKQQDIEVEYVIMNEQGTFFLIEIIKDESLEKVYWYKILTQLGTVGYFFLGDEDFDALKLYFVKQSK